jgi:hypothetical protein
MYIHSRISCRYFLMDLPKASQRGRWSLFRPRRVRQRFRHETYINTRDYTGEEFCSAFPVFSDISKSRDPLHLLSGYIAEVGTTCLVSYHCSPYCIRSQTSIIQQASDCDKILVHDDDLLMFDGIGRGTVSGLLSSSCIVLLMLAVTGIPRTGRDDGSLPEVRHNDT